MICHICSRRCVLSVTHVSDDVYDQSHVSGDVYDQSHVLGDVYDLSRVTMGADHWAVFAEDCTGSAKRLTLMQVHSSLTSLCSFIC